MEPFSGNLRLFLQVIPLKSMNDQLHLLTEILLDKNAREDERGDAAIV